MIVLIDTSVWIEFFKKTPAMDPSHVGLLLEERCVATCLPIQAEVLSGKMSAEVRLKVARGFDAMTFLDPEWSSPSTWERLVEMALQARGRGAGLPGLVDRMILLTAMTSGAALWTRDRKLQRMADQLGVVLFSPPG